MKTKSENSKSMNIVRGGLRRPNWICRNVRQNVVIIRDKSSSMSGKKTKDASNACLDLVAELAEPTNKDGFYVGVVDFASNSKVVHDLVKATTLHGVVDSLSLGISGGSTNITAGLEDALSILEKAKKQNYENLTYLRPVGIIFTDGCHNKGPEPHKIANRLKSIADLVTVAFGSDADEGLMRSLATSPQHFYRCSTGRELRTFLAAVGATMTATLAVGKNATQALTTIQQ